MRYSTVILIAKNPAAHGVYEQSDAIRTQHYCEVRSVSRMESYEALSHGLHPSVVLVLSDYREYNDQQLCEFEGVAYRILRTYVREDHHIELTLEKVVAQ